LEIQLKFVVLWVEINGNPKILPPFPGKYLKIETLARYYHPPQVKDGIF
jgi:hypothetical protein